MSRMARLFVCGWLSIPFAAFSAPTEPTPPASTIHFSIPAQSLSTALIAFGKQANLQVLTASCTIVKLRSDGVSDTLTADAAIATLLRGTGLSYAFIDAQTVVIAPPASALMGAGGRAPLSIGAMVANAKLLESVDVQGLIGRDIGFMADATSSATRTDSALIDVPQSISVVTRDLIDSQQMSTVADALRGVAGAQAIDGSDGLPLFQIRGFYTGNGMTDGMPNSFVGSSDYPPLIGVERVEVLKGPQSVLGDYSIDNNFGGLINLVLKAPQSEPVREVSYGVGEYGDIQAGVDLAGPLGSSKDLTYRLVLSGENADRTAQGYQGQRNSYFAPSIGWKHGSTTLIVGITRNINEVPIPDHTILLDDSLSSATPSGLLLGNAQDRAAYKTSRLYYLLEQRLNDTWVFRSRGQYTNQTTNQDSWALSNPVLTGDTNATADRYRYTDAYYTLQNDLVATFEQGVFTHKVVVGVDYTRSRIGSSDDFYDSSGSMSYNVFTSAPLAPVRSLGDLSIDDHTPGGPWSTDSGLFLQDQIAFGEHWKVLLALRRWAYELSTEDANGNPWTLHKTRWVPNAGVVYQTTPDIAFYGTVSSGFQTDTLLGQNGQPLPPASSRQIETGAKFDLFDHQALLTTSVYRIMLDHSVDILS
ncbi:MAG: TonB-dependent receptor, partial [Rhodanobacter sp.]